MNVFLTIFLIGMANVNGIRAEAGVGYIEKDDFNEILIKAGNDGKIPELNSWYIPSANHIGIVFGSKFNRRKYYKIRSYSNKVRVEGITENSSANKLLFDQELNIEGSFFPAEKSVVWGERKYSLDADERVAIIDKSLWNVRIFDNNYNDFTFFAIEVISRVKAGEGGSQSEYFLISNFENPYSTLVKCSGSPRRIFTSGREVYVLYEDNDHLQFAIFEYKKSKLNSKKKAIISFEDKSLYSSLADVDFSNNRLLFYRASNKENHLFSRHYFEIFSYEKEKIEKKGILPRSATNIIFFNRVNSQ